MSGVTWSRPAAKASNLYFVNTKGMSIVCMVDEPNNFPCILLHWLEKPKRTSVPCIGDGCVHCASVPVKNVCYAPVLHFARNQGRWYQAILCIGDSSYGLSQTDYRGGPIQVGPSKEPHDKGRIISYGKCRDKLPALPQIVKPFDIRPNLMRRWGMFKEAELIECARHEATPQEVLLTGTDGGSLLTSSNQPPTLFTGDDEHDQAR